MRFSDTVTLVTGGNRGIGEAIVRAIVGEGGQVVFTGRDETTGNALAQELGGKAQFMVQDAGVEADWVRIVEFTMGIGDRIDGLVNNAGLMGKNPLAETSMDLVASLVATNQTSVLLGIKHVVGPMRKAGRGSIVNIGSVVVRRGMADVSAYSAVKSAVAGITRAAAMELGPDQIRVNTIHPGAFATRMLFDNMGDAGLVYGATATPLRRVGQPKEMAGPVLFLLSDESAYVTGAELCVDGGLSL